MRRSSRYWALRYRVWCWHKAIQWRWLELLEWWEEIRAVQQHRRIAEELSRNPMGYGRKPFVEAAKR